MTRAGTAGKAMILLSLCAFSAALTWRELATGNTTLFEDAMLYGLGGGLVAALIVTFRPRTAPFLAPVYAVLEGLALGSVSWLVNARYPGIPQQALMLTFMVAMIVFLLYRANVLRATARFRRVVVSATIGIAVFYLLRLAFPVVGSSLGFSGSATWWSVLVNVVIAGVAALNLVLDFDAIDAAVAARAPRRMEWYGAFSLMVTLVWLYVELLQLLGAGEE